MLRDFNSRLFTLISLLFLIAPQLFAADLETQKEKESYSIGYQVGRSMKTDGVEVDFDKLIQGMQDAIKDKKPVLSNREMRALIVELKKRSSEEQMRKFQEQTVANAEQSKVFLEENRTKEGVWTTESGLQYRVLTKGEGNSPGPDDTVTVNYRGRFTDGTEFDSSYKRGEPATFKVSGVIKGWTEALQIMKPGAKWELYVPPELAYGRRGAPPKIQPNQMLMFEVELISIDDVEKKDLQSKKNTSQNHMVKKMSLKGQIVKSRNGYIIRSRKGNAPGEIFTIRNPEPKMLDGFVSSKDFVSIEARVISGDNLEIEKIDGRSYN